MHKWWTVVIALLIIIIVGVVLLVAIPAPTAKAPTTSTPSTTASSTSSLADTIVVDLPAPNAAVTSPVTITGKARGTWYFEATAPVALLDSNGSVIAQGTIHATADWMTTEFVPFTGSLTFAAQPAGSSGTLVLTNDNPSGDPSKQKTLDIPVTF